jgi:hypothetical protein
MEFLRGARRNNSNPRALVVGGGGYTFPRYAMEAMNDVQMDVVEIDPGVTWMAKNHLGLKDYDRLKIHHMDGRQYVSEKVPPGTYDLVVQDAVNDLSVPSHLLTKEYNDAVKATLKPNGVYLLTVIDSIGYGKLWKAAMHTLQESYPAENVALLLPNGVNPEYITFTPYDYSMLWYRQTVPETVLLRLSHLRGRRFTRESLIEELSDLLDPNEFRQYKSGILEVVDLTRYKLTDEVLSSLQILRVPEPVLAKLKPLHDTLFTWEGFQEKLGQVLNHNEFNQYENLILEHSVEISGRQVLVIYASDHPLNLAELRAAVAEQVVPSFTSASRVGNALTRMQPLGGMQHFFAMTSLKPKDGDEELGAIFMTHRAPPCVLQPYLDTPPRIVLTDQYAPVDNLMMDVFRYRDRGRR